MISDNTYDYVSSSEIDGILYVLLMSGTELGVYKIIDPTPILVCSTNLGDYFKPMYPKGEILIKNSLPGILYTGNGKNFTLCKVLYTIERGFSVKMIGIMTKHRMSISDTIPSVVSRDGIDEILTIVNGVINL